MKAHQRTVGMNDEWITPRWITSALGHFDLDPCSPVDPPWQIAKASYSVIDDGLSSDWHGRVWLNPPFNRYERSKWMEKMALHGNGIMLIPAACETKPFRDFVWGKCDSILFLRKRPHFYFIDGSEAKANSGCTICLVAYGESNTDSLLQSGLGYVVKEAWE